MVHFSLFVTFVHNKRITGGRYNHGKHWTADESQAGWDANLPTINRHRVLLSGCNENAVRDVRFKGLLQSAIQIALQQVGVLVFVREHLRDHLSERSVWPNVWLETAGQAMIRLFGVPAVFAISLGLAS
jgi:hypothetical protein